MFSNTLGIGLVVGACACGQLADAAVIAAWHFDETGGTTASDAVGSTNGALAGDAAFITGGISGGAVSLSIGGNGFVDMGDNFGYSGNSTFSLVAWVRVAQGDTGGYLVAGRHHATVVSGYFLSVNNAGSGSGEVPGSGMFYQGYPNPVSADLALNDGEWHQLVGVHDLAGGETRLYVDGALQATQAYNPFGLADADFSVGGVRNPAGTQTIGALNGSADEVSLWDTALTDDDVRYLFDHPGSLDVPTPSVLALLTGAFGMAASRRSRR